MPSLSFYPRFTDQVATGKKNQSVRTRSFRHGDLVHLRNYAGKLLGTGHVTCVRDVLIDYRRYVPVIKIDGDTLSSKSMEAFARKDGFADLDAFINFFSDHYDLPFRGFVIEWALVKEEAVTAVCSETIEADVEG